jgi:molybdopterin-containing oxidoreductase family iron-sulfur binding subunit
LLNVSQVEHHVSGQQYWRSIEQLAQSPEMREQIAKEFPGYDPDQLLNTSRRSFLKLMGASLALAGVTLTGCRRWPKENIVPQTSNVEGKIPGIPEDYATVMELNGVGRGLLVKSYDGRPIKVEGNPLHPFARIDSPQGAPTHGSADRYAQASVLELYDPERARSVMERAGVRYTEANFDGFLAAAKEMFTGDGSAIAVLTEATSSPSFFAMKKKFLAKFPKAKWYEYEPISDDNERQATQIAFGQALRPQLQLEKADVIFSLDSDFIDSHPAHTRYANDWVKRRKSADQGAMSRVYVAESRYSLTGAIADQRLPIKPSRAGKLAAGLAGRLGVAGFGAAVDLTPEETKFLDAAAADLKAAGKNAVVTAGCHLPPDVQAVALAINAQLGAIGNTMVLRPVLEPERPTHADAIKQLGQDLQQQFAVQTLLILGGNPAYDAPADLEFAKNLAQIPHTIHLSLYRNETSVACLWNVPKAHYLESWGDARAYDGTVSVQQPLIEPLFGGVTPTELLAMLCGEQVVAGQQIVRNTIGGLLGANNNEKAYRKVLHDGILEGSALPAVTPTVKAVAAPKDVAISEPFEIRFLQDASLYDGRFAPNAWLQEMPDPLTKLVWDNAALISKKDADALGVDNGGMLNITAGGKTLSIAAYIMPGQPVGVIGLPLGYGRGQAGKIGSGLGFDTYQLRTTAGLSVAGATVAKAGGTYSLVTTQDHHIIDEQGMKGREKRVGEKHESGIIIREASLVDYKKNPNAPHPPKEGSLSLQLFQPPINDQWPEPAYEGAPAVFNKPHAWGMAIDMTACIGCQACVVACQSENNIPVVGKVEVDANREMHWLRIDRYFKGPVDDPNPEVAFQPMMCVHCENAPCEQVCPVGATMHDSEGLNAMVYNRCVGTRYCSNNCPYKVRRFNYFDWQSLDPRGGRFPAPWPNLPDTQQRESIDPIKQMVFNPEVTVRMRGVMEKCTYCVQRLSRAKIDARNAHLAGERDSDIVQEGEVLTACQQACPTQAIVFGNLNDEKAAVSKLHKNPRAYSVLEELDTRPRSKHLAKIRNPNETLEAAEPKSAETEHA